MYIYSPLNVISANRKLPRRGETERRQSVDLVKLNDVFSWIAKLLKCNNQKDFTLNQNLEKLKIF